jgi:hypothetical protein
MVITSQTARYRLPFIDIQTFSKAVNPTEYSILIRPKRPTSRVNLCENAFFLPVL